MNWVSWGFLLKALGQKQAADKIYSGMNRLHMVKGNSPRLRSLEQTCWLIGRMSDAMGIQRVFDPYEKTSTSLNSFFQLSIFGGPIYATWL